MDYQDVLAAEEKKTGGGLGMPGPKDAEKGEGLGMPQTREAEGREDEGKEKKVNWGEEGAETKEASRGSEEEIEWADSRARLGEE